MGIENHVTFSLTAEGRERDERKRQKPAFPRATHESIVTRAVMGRSDGAGRQPFLYDPEVVAAFVVAFVIGAPPGPYDLPALQKKLDAARATLPECMQG